MSTKDNSKSVQYSITCLIINVIINNHDIFDDPISIHPLGNSNIVTTVGLKKPESIDNPVITYFDKFVLDSIYTHIKRLRTHPLASFEPLCFSTNSIVRDMFGNTSVKPTTVKVDAINESILKLSNIQISIDATDEMIARKVIKNGETWMRESKLLPVENTPIQSENHISTMNGYTISEASALYEYAETCRQISRYDDSYLLPGTVSDTIENIMLTRYLISRIAYMYNAKTNCISHEISLNWYDDHAKKNKGLLPDLGINLDSTGSKRALRDKRNVIIKKVVLILDSFRSLGIITDYDCKLNDVGSIIKFTINLSNNTRKHYCSDLSYKPKEQSREYNKCIDIYRDDTPF